MTTSQNFSILSPYIQWMLEAHIIRLGVKHRWGLPLKVLKPINLFKLKKGFFLSRSSPPCSATCVSNANFGPKFRGNPPQSYQGGVMKNLIPLGGPQPTCEEVQQALAGNSLVALQLDRGAGHLLELSHTALWAASGTVRLPRGLL